MRQIDKSDWLHAEIRPGDLVCVEVQANEIGPKSIHRVKSKNMIRRFRIVQLGSEAAKTDPRLEVGKIILPVIELARYYSPDGFFVFEAKNVAVTWPLGHFEEKGEE